MKLLTYQYKFFGPRAGMKLDDEVLDLTVLLNCRSSPISDIGALLRRFDDPVAAIQAALHSGAKQETLPHDRLLHLPSRSRKMQAQVFEILWQSLQHRQALSP